jgi:hypothetical protein
MWIDYMDLMTHWCTSKLLKENLNVIIYWKKVCITWIFKWNEGLKYELYSLFILVSDKVDFYIYKSSIKMHVGFRVLFNKV